jgi:hypothetical protein
MKTRKNLKRFVFKFGPETFYRLALRTRIVKGRENKKPLLVRGAFRTKPKTKRTTT